VPVFAAEQSLENAESTHRSPRRRVPVSMAAVSPSAAPLATGIFFRLAGSRVDKRGASTMPEHAELVLGAPRP
ncbi:MAG: hypothetical protein AB7E78_14515, partial [Porticoccaceae bacterium]